MNRFPSGFTLIELMITIFIASLLAVLVVPVYIDHMHRARIAEATGQLNMMSLRLEQFFQDNRNYGSDPDCGVGLPATANFVYTCVASDSGASYLLTATGTMEEDMQDFQFTLDQSGLRQTLTVPAGWATVPTNCWIMKRGAVCP
jgi:type IV pilus assembly protein PilE